MHDDFGPFVPSSIVEMMLDWSRARWRTPFGCFYESLVKSTLAWSQRRGTSGASRSEVNSAFFPMPLPYPEAVHPDMGSETKPFELRRRGKRVSTEQFTNLLVALANFYEMDCPRGGAQLVFPEGEPGAAQQAAVQRFRDDAEEFCASSGGVIDSTGRGRGRLNSMVLSLGHRYSEAGRTMRACKTVTVAEDVIPEKISLPTRAGHLLGSDVMCRERARVFADLSVLELEHDLVPGRNIRPCHRIDRDAEKRFIKSMLDRDMIALIDEREIERHPITGGLLKGGFSAVPHKAGRLISWHEYMKLSRYQRAFSVSRMCSINHFSGELKWLMRSLFFAQVSVAIFRNNYPLPETWCKALRRLPRPG